MDIREGQFSYDDYWKDEELKQETERSEQKRALFEQFNDGAKKARVDPQIRYDIYRLIDGEKDSFRQETLDWLKKEFGRGVHKRWNDAIAKFLKEKTKEMA